MLADFLNTSIIIQSKLIMSFVSDYLTPIIKAYSTWIEGSYLSEHLGSKGSAGELGGDYISKVNRANRRSVTQRYDDTLSAVKSPTLSSFIIDNIPRLLLNPLDRLVAAYQAYPSLSARFSKPGTFSHTFTEIMNEGAFLGAYKGLIFNAAQLGLVLYPSVFFTNRNAQNKFFTFATTYTVLDALFYPVDTLKNILYADTLGKYSIKSVSNHVSLVSLYKGIQFKLLYNLPVISGLYCSTQTGLENQAWLSWAAAFLLYPLNTLKVRGQVSASSISTINANTGFIYHSAYRGAVPFILLNILVGYSLKPLFSQEKLNTIKAEVDAELEQKGY